MNDEDVRDLENKILSSHPSLRIKEERDIKRHYEAQKENKELFGSLEQAIKLLKSALHEKLSVSDAISIENSEKINKCISKVSDIVSGHIDQAVNVNTKKLEVIASLLAELGRKETTVNVEAPIVNVPSPVVLDKTKIIQETKYTQASNQILMKILEYTMKQQGEGVMIQNSSEKESIPVRLVDKSGESFYNAITSALAPVSGGFQVGKDSASNSTTTPLSNGAVFTGLREKNDFPYVSVSCKTDQSGLLEFEFSNDGENWDDFPTQGFVLVAGVHKFASALKNGRYFRIKITNNSGSDQTYLRAYTYFGFFPTSNAPLNQSAAIDQDAIFTRSTVPQDEIVLGRRTGVTSWNKFAYRNGLTATNGEETVWSTTGNFTPLTTASTYTIAYNNTTDGLGTTGALSLIFYYVDDNGLPATGTHTLGNTGSDVTTFSGLGINRVAVVLTGTANTNTNDIIITATTGGTTQAIIPAPDVTGAKSSVTQQAIFFVGSNHTAIVKYIEINVIKPSGSNAKITVKGYVYNRNVGTTYEVYRVPLDTSVLLRVTKQDPIGFPLNSTDVLYFIADTDTNNANITINFSLNEYRKT